MPLYTDDSAGINDSIETTAKKILDVLNSGNSALGGGGEVGTGSPEGVVTADPGVTYLDLANDSLWIKKTGTGTNTGWIQLLV